MASTDPPGAGQGIKLTDLTGEQLSQIKKQLDEELTNLTKSFQSLRTAQDKFRDCTNTVNTGLANITPKKEILVPLTSSLYVPGRLADAENVIVELGTGFFLKLPKAKAKEYFERKVAELGDPLFELDKIVRQKSESLHMVEEVIRENLLALNSTNTAQT